MKEQYILFGIMATTLIIICNYYRLSKQALRGIKGEHKGIIITIIIINCNYYSLSKRALKGIKGEHKEGKGKHTEMNPSGVGQGESKYDKGSTEISENRGLQECKGIIFTYKHNHSLTVGVH